MSNNTTQTDAPSYPPSMEFYAYETLPPQVRKVIQEAPFNVGVADFVNNRQVMAVFHELGPDKFAEWLKGMLVKVYREKLCA